MMGRTVIVWGAAFLIAAGASPTPEATFQADPETLQGTGATRLSWRWLGAEEGYLTNVGLLGEPKAGARMVDVGETTNFVLILEGRGRSVVLSRRVVVKGSKGDDDSWPNAFQPFAVENHYHLGRASLPRLIEKVNGVLQNQLGYRVHDFSLEPGEVVLNTAFLQGRAPIPSAHGPARWVRRAIRVEIKAPIESASIEVGVSARVDFRLVVDERWYPEPPSSSALYRDAIDEVRGRIGRDNGGGPEKRI